ncbi:MAG: site-2 protease family protein [bacterium]|nr:site-2 protease family protein [bacterium]
MNLRFLKFSETELIDLLWAWAALSFAFAVFLGGGIDGFREGFFVRFILAGVTVGVAFLFHEIAHKVVAQRYGHWAEFQKFDWGLVFAVGMSFFGFIFAAPGAVMIRGMVSGEQNGKISIAGPITNIVIASIFFVLGIALTQILGELPSLLNQIIFYGFFINAWLALFNMIPFGPLDGAKVMAWSLPAWLTVGGIAAFLVFFVA